MTRIIGIDLGTTNSVLSELRARRPSAVPIKGSVIVPSVVLYLDDRVVVGREAHNLELQHPGRLVRSAKRRMGTDHRYTVGARSLSAEEVAAEVLGELKREGEKALGEPLRKVVITVPAYFDDAQRRATLRAGELAGFEVLRLLNEPTAASLVYDHVEPKSDAAGSSDAGSKEAGSSSGASDLVLVYDLGGGTFDVSVLEVADTVREVRSTAGNTHLGGDDFDEKLVQHFLDLLRDRDGVDPRDDLRAMARLRRAAEACKIQLSSELTVRVREEFIAAKGEAQVHLDVEVTRRELEAMIHDSIESTLELTARALTDANITAAELARIVLVGGSTRIPLVRRRLRERFSTDIHDEIDPDLAVAHGAAVQSALLQGAEVDRILVDVAAHTLGVRVVGHLDDYGAEPDTFAPILPKNTVLPARRSEEVYTMVDDQTAYRVDVFQGESPRVSKNTLVGSFLHELEPRPASSPVVVTFEYDLNGIVRITVSQPGGASREAIAMSVADAGREAQGASSASIEAKAGAVRATLDAESQRQLDALLTEYTQAKSPEARRRAEDRLIDLFLDAESAGEDDDDADSAGDD